MAIKARYHSKDGEYHEGIPARHLSDEEYEALSGDQKRLVRYGGLYTMVEEKEKPATSKTAQERGAVSETAEKEGG